MTAPAQRRASCSATAEADLTALPELDRAQADAFWARYCASTDRDPRRSIYTAFDCFGDSVELADELIDLVINGPKRATAGSIGSYEADGTGVPNAGDEWIAADGRGAPRAVIRATEVRIGPLSSVDDAFAWDEGEGDRSRDYWLRAHTEFFERYHAALGIPFHPDIDVAFERFEVAYSEPPAASVATPNS
ncbi:MAG: ASCH domain-containing protein [Acidimicrobiia bacterium]|nr:ASCH domain-containing protein [Acidimicrobiia bacterium]